MKQNTETYETFVERNDMGSRQLTQSEIIEKVKISRTTLFRLIKEGLPFSESASGKKYFDEDEVRNFIKTRKDNLINDLIVGKEYTNDEIVEIFKVSFMGGMRRSNSRNALVLISFQDGSDRLYNDYWQNDILYYTGAGQLGDQEMISQNKTLAESNQNGITVYLFEKFIERKYQYRGIVKLVGKPKCVTECDVSGAPRKVWKFPLKLINEKDYVDGALIDEQEEKVNYQAKISIEEYLKNWDEFKKTQEIAKHGAEQTERTVKATRVLINPVVGEYVRMRAGKYCELCRREAPFEYNGMPYLELSHVKTISEGGKDSADNVAALCPNCNARLSKLCSERDKNTLLSNMKKNEKDLQRQLKGEK